MLESEYKKAFSFVLGVFFQVLLPKMKIPLYQAMGKLIHREIDKGIISIFDSSLERLWDAATERVKHLAYSSKIYKTYDGVKTK